MAEGIDLPGASHDRCRCLRSKEMYIEVEPHPDDVHYGSGIYWCTHTQNCLGPDGLPASPEHCKPGRACYDAL